MKRRLTRHGMAIRAVAIAWAMGAGALTAPAATGAQVPRPAAHAAEGSPQVVSETSPQVAGEETRPRRWFLFWSRASDQDRLVWGQWSWHINNEKRPNISNDEIGAVVYRGAFFGTFVTTHGDRAWTVGVERDWASIERGPFGAMVGFRTGLVYGYDEQLGWLAEATPILPFASPMVQARAGPITAELTHTWVVLSLTAGVRF